MFCNCGEAVVVTEVVVVDNGAEVVVVVVVVVVVSEEIQAGISLLSSSMTSMVNIDGYVTGHCGSNATEPLPLTMNCQTLWATPLQKSRVREKLAPEVSVNVRAMSWVPCSLESKVAVTEAKVRANFWEIDA